MKKLILSVALLLAAVNLTAGEDEQNREKEHTFVSVNVAAVSGDLNGEQISVGVSVDVLEHVALLGSFSIVTYDGDFVPNYEMQVEQRTFGVLGFHDFGLETGTKFEAVFLLSRLTGFESYGLDNGESNIENRGEAIVKTFGVAVIQEIGSKVELKLHVSQAYEDVGFEFSTLHVVPEVSVELTELLTVNGAYHWNDIKRNEAFSLGLDFAF